MSQSNMFFAEAASALNHPNICTIYDIGKSGEQSLIAIEFLEGVTLKNRIAGRPVETDILLGLAIEIADAPIGDENVRRFDVAVDDPLRVGGILRYRRRCRSLSLPEGCATDSARDYHWPPLRLGGPCFLIGLAGYRNPLVNGARAPCAASPYR